MRIIISPAKKMRVDPDSLPHTGLPAFLPQTELLLAALRALDRPALKRLWKCSDTLTDQNLERLQTMDLTRNLTPAILSYEGIQYRYMAPGVLETEPLAYLQKHLRIVSGFYGLVRPFDGVTPYRLEMQARLAVGDAADLYAFWGNRLGQALATETDWVLNLASREYSSAVLPHLPAGTRALTCTFGEEQNGRVIEKGTQCKMARGQMVRWMATHNITCPEELVNFHDLGYNYAPAYSKEDHLVFLHTPDRAKD